MSNELKMLIKEDTVFLEKAEPLTGSDRDKVKSLSADLETKTNKKLVVRCLVVAALLMCVLQSRQIVSALDKLSPGFFSDSARVIAREWHGGMERIGASRIKDHMSQHVHNMLPGLNPRHQTASLQVTMENGESIWLRGAGTFEVPTEKAKLEEEPKALSRFGEYKFRGSF